MMDAAADELEQEHIMSSITVENGLTLYIDDDMACAAWESDTGRQYMVNMGYYKDTAPPDPEYDAYQIASLEEWLE